MPALPVPRRRRASLLRFSLIGVAWLASLCVVSTAHGQIQNNFNAGNNTYGWTLVGAFVDCSVNCTAQPHNFTGMFWDDTTNYPTASIGVIPRSDSRGSLRFDTSTSGDGVPGTGTYWIMQVTSPDLSTNPGWQQIYRYQVRLMANMNSGPLWVNLFVRVYDNDQQRDRYFYSGTAQPVTKLSWNTFDFDWANAPTFPTNYTLRNLIVHVWGSMAQNYTSGSVWIDDVSGFQDSVSPSISITSPTANATYATTSPDHRSRRHGGRHQRHPGRQTSLGPTRRQVPTERPSGTANWSVAGIPLAGRVEQPVRHSP